MYKKPIIYQLLPRLFGNENSSCIPHGSIQENGTGKFAHINTAALTAIKRLGVTHIWLTGIIEHASTTDYSAYGIAPVDACLVKGKAGSPYAIRDYYDVCPDLAQDVPRRMAEFEDLVRRCHDCGLLVLIDFVPNHVFRQYASDAKPLGVDDFGEDNFYGLPGTRFVSPVAGDYQEAPAKASGNDCFRPDPSLDDWYETVKLNYNLDTWHKMRDILSFWVGKGVDGFRCDMAEMAPTDFWAWVIPQIKTQKKEALFIAEVYRPELYRDFIACGFDYLYDKVGLYDTLKAVLRGERPADDISRCWQQLGDLQPAMLHFLENHDEQRIASDFFMGDGFKALPALVVSACLNTSAFMLYAGQEFGERGMDAEGFSGLDGRTSIFDYWSPDSLRRFYHRGQCNTEQLSLSERRLYGLYTDLFSLIDSCPALAWGATYDLVYANRHHGRFDPRKHFAFLRYAADREDELLLVAVNFDNRPADMDIHIPPHALEHFGMAGRDWTSGTLLFGTADTDGLMRTPFSLGLPAWGAAICLLSFHGYRF
ncbi:MAG: alpha-amylase family glycosyl hydrolase [Bacteroidales bacterium]|nr:alpha-amylase family glycosyl hydrolase [Bacteroidales bacterium]